jgi:tetratricopeptide (TPR) repeat protein
MVRRALGVAPASPDLYHVRGELHQARGLEFLEKRRPEHAANEIHAAVKAYGEAIEQAEAKNLLASRAATYFRLGEICYFAHGDVNGARAYWQKVVDLHTPTPEPSEPVTEYRRHTYLKVRLLTWQEWAAAYLRRLEEVEFGPRPQPSPAPGPSGAPRRDEAAPTDPGLAPETVAPPAPGDDPATPAP